MDASAKFSRDPLQIIVEIEKALEPTREDFLYAGNLQVSRIKERTARGVDYQGKAFAPYSTKRPVYWYPSVHLKNREASRDRFLKKIGGETGAANKTGIGIKFASYAALKESVSGSNVVNLTGLRAPHMLMQIVVKVNGKQLVIGIYGDAAERADAHNNGAPGRGLPKREFFNAGDSDKAEMASDLLEAGVARANKGTP